MWKRVAIALAAALLVFAGITAWALESAGVAVLETTSPGGSTRETHVWFAVLDGELWVEVGAPENGWYRDVLHEPVLRFSSEEISGPFRARLDEDPGAHPRLRSALREKYGLRDQWVGLLVDSSRSMAVQLHSAPHPAEQER